MKRLKLTLGAMLVIAATIVIMYQWSVAVEEKKTASELSKPQLEGYVGSSSCRECHENFYKLWSTSRHGLAMQPYTTEFARTHLTPQHNEVVIGKFKYNADVDHGIVIENGPDAESQYRIEQALGGKNVYYFLTPLKKGRLQTLPVAYDVNKKEWFDTSASGMRHFPGGGNGQVVNWKESPYTFNTSCYSCHVSQLSTNYDPKTDTYHTTWAEPGINCETCHGPSATHFRIAKATPKGQVLPELAIIRVKTMTKEQRNDLCLSCHAKGSPLTLEYKPQEKFFDHFDLVTLEDPDYYPDGRDLGENYTATSWRMSPCAKSGQLDCLHCHTSSGRYRFKEEGNVNQACLPCHAERVKKAAAHTHHQKGSPGNRCISCHMPMTAFARMNRSDHSMLPPTPSATITFHSPNACNLCHSDKSPNWADKYVRQWHHRDYQAPVLRRASLVDAARKRDWRKLPGMLVYLQSADRDEIFTTSLIRLLMSSSDERVNPVLLTALKDSSPLVRSAAAEAIATKAPSSRSIQADLEAMGDGYRIVRIRAAAGLAGYAVDRLSGDMREKVEKANQEYLTFVMARPDQWTSYYNLGNYQLGRGELKLAVASYQTALRLEPQAIMAMVNASIAYAQMGEYQKVEDALAQALRIAPDNAAVNLNMGLLQAEKNDPRKAELYLKKAIESDPQMAQAAYNLCILTVPDRMDEALAWCRRAVDLKPGEPKYAFTLAYYLNQKGDRMAAISCLKGILRKFPAYPDAYLLLGEIYEQLGNPSEAEKVYAKALTSDVIPNTFKHRIRAQLATLKQSGAVGVQK